VFREWYDQRDIQAMGGLCVRYPVSYIVCKLLRYYNLRRILDVTYGEGRFYMLCGNYLDKLIGCDPVRRDWVVKPNEFYQYNVFQLYWKVRDKVLQPYNIDVVVIDPPKWNPDYGYHRREMFNYLIGTPNLIVEYGFKVAELLNVNNVLVHYREVVKHNTYKPLHIVNFVWLARYVKTRSPNISYFILYSK